MKKNWGMLPLLMGLIGCKANHPVPAHPPSPMGPHTASSAKTSSLEEPLKGTIRGTGWQVRWNIHKNNFLYSPMVPLLRAQANGGSLLYKGQTLSLVLQNVKARLYEQGEYVADVQADKVVANQQHHLLIGEGHVRVLSKRRPPNTVITSDKMVWEGDSNRIVAEGNAHLVQKRPGAAPYEAFASRMVYNIQTGEITALQ